MPRRRSSLRLALRLLPGAISLAILIWALASNPFTRPFVAASTAEVKQALDRALARRVTPDWLAVELDAAFAADDSRRVETLMLIASDVGVAPGPARKARVEAYLAANEGAVATAGDCVACMAEVESCPSVRLLTVCTIPFEMTPAGDLNALRRAGVAWWSDEPVDRLDVTLAMVGLGATAAIVVSGGTSVTVKAGASVLRIARRLGTVTPRFARHLATVSDIGLKPGRLLPYLAGRVPLDEVVDTARLARMSDLSGDFARVAGNASITDAALMLRHVDTAEDAARLARLSDAAGPATRPAMEVLGKRRAFRVLVRLSRGTATAAALVYAAVLQLLTSVAGWIGGRILRAVIRAI